LAGKKKKSHGEGVAWSLLLPLLSPEEGREEEKKKRRRRGARHPALSAPLYLTALGRKNNKRGGKEEKRREAIAFSFPNSFT